MDLANLRMRSRRKARKMEETPEEPPAHQSQKSINHRETHPNRRRVQLNDEPTRTATREPAAATHEWREPNSTPYSAIKKNAPPMPISRKLVNTMTASNQFWTLDA
jgi:hypothetical protein